jgi:hypothetical protein
MTAVSTSPSSSNCGHRDISIVLEADDNIWVTNFLDVITVFSGALVNVCTPHLNLFSDQLLCLAT